MSQTATADPPLRDSYGHRRITWAEARRLACHIARRYVPAGEYGWDDEDLAQVGLIGLWRAFGAGDPLPAGSPLVSAILSRRMLDELKRKGWRARPYPPVPTRHLSEPRAGGAAAEPATLGERLPAREDVETVALARLTLRQALTESRGNRDARAACLRAAGYEAREIARAWGVSEGRVNQRLARYRREARDGDAG